MKEKKMEALQDQRYLSAHPIMKRMLNAFLLGAVFVFVCD